MTKGDKKFIDIKYRPPTSETVRGIGLGWEMEHVFAFLCQCQVFFAVLYPAGIFVHQMCLYGRFVFVFFRSEVPHQILSGSGARKNTRICKLHHPSRDLVCSVCSKSCILMDFPLTFSCSLVFKNFKKIRRTPKIWNCDADSLCASSRSFALMPFRCVQWLTAGSKRQNAVSLLQEIRMLPPCWQNSRKTFPPTSWIK